MERDNGRQSMHILRVVVTLVGGVRGAVKFHSIGWHGCSHRTNTARARLATMRMLVVLRSPAKICQA